MTSALVQKLASLLVMIGKIGKVAYTDERIKLVI
jgi:hypothetical protein